MEVTPRITTAIYKNEQGQDLLSERVFLNEIPPINRKIKYLQTLFKVVDVLEDYDKEETIITVKLIYSTL